MLLLKDDILKVPQVGPKSKTLLGKMNVRNVNDLLYHFPFRYEDRSLVKKISDVKVGEKVTVTAKITSVKNVFTKNRKRITRGVAEDDSGEIQLIWFNMHFIARNIRVGETYLIYGSVESFEKKNTFIVPEMEEIGESNIHLGRIVPIYPTTEGIRTKWIRSRINDLLSMESEVKFLEEFLPKEIIKKQDFPLWQEAIHNIHFPQDFSLLERAKSRLAYEELFIELINASLVERQWKLEAKAFPLNDLKRGQAQQNFMKNIPFELTKDQKQAIGEILQDLKEARPMNRLLEGDVGTGKTIVAIVTALQALIHEKSVLYMAPTEILAQQHFETFLKFLGPLG
ncbi:MAG TPA: DEAD/DEAH box helicase, partial [Bacteroidetes bacterium]|nr:DEAD/DEAH box helicase [Bacteroidota bacterium]